MSKTLLVNKTIHYVVIFSREHYNYIKYWKYITNRINEEKERDVLLLYAKACDPKNKKKAHSRVTLQMYTTFIDTVTNLIWGDDAILPFVPIMTVAKKNLHIQDDIWIASLHLYLQCFFFSSEYFLGTHIFRASFLNFVPLSFHALEPVEFTNRFQNRRFLCITVCILEFIVYKFLHNSYKCFCEIINFYGFTFLSSNSLECFNS